LISLAPGFIQVIFRRLILRNRLNGFRIGERALVTRLKPGANEILELQQNPAEICNLNLSSSPNSKRLPGMTSAAGLEIQIAAEGSFSIMTSGARVVAVGEVFQCPRRTNLASLRQSSGVTVTFGATETLTRAVLRVAERVTKRGRISRRSAIRFLIVTDAARCDVASF
jgi:hypothetical protein